jgi:hypothetical protein
MVSVDQIPTFRHAQSDLPVRLASESNSVGGCSCRLHWLTIASFPTTNFVILIGIFFRVGNRRTPAGRLVLTESDIAVRPPYVVGCLFNTHPSDRPHGTNGSLFSHSLAVTLRLQAVQTGFARTQQPRQMFPIARSTAASSRSSLSTGSEETSADAGWWRGGRGAVPMRRGSGVSDGGTVGFAGAIKPCIPEPCIPPRA